MTSAESPAPIVLSDIHALVGGELHGDGGATVAAWYPITPSSSLAEAFQFYCSKMRVDKETGKNKFAIIQAEDELASIGIVVGAGWNGARAFTSTSGPTTATSRAGNGVLCVPISVGAEGLEMSTICTPSGPSAT